MKPFSELLSGLGSGKLSIADFVQQINERGSVQGPMHRAELGMLDAALAAGKLDERLHRSLTNKLKDVQTKGSATVTVIKNMPPVRGNNDATQLAPGAVGGDATRVNPGAASGDATRVNPGAAGGAGFDLLIDTGDDSEKTQMGGGDDSAATTAFKSSEPATATGGTSGPRTGGTSAPRTGGPSTSSWNRVAASGAPEREVHSGDVLKDRFFLDKEVGRGGMGIVFKARDERKVEAQDKNPWVAVKVLNPEFRKHPQALVALQRESRKAQQLTHDNILRVYDFDKDGTVIYMTMEYVDGGSLKDVIKKHPNGMPFEKGWPIIAGLANGLGRAHRDNIVHSDFKPGNVMMTTDMIPKLFDMGIARAAKSGAEAKGETTVFDAGELGALTPAYASLEMIQGQPPELIDDIYALGITAYEILTGKHPFAKKNAEQVMKEGMKPPVVPGLSRKQRKTLEASVAFKREDRIQTCDKFLEGMRKQTAKDFAVPVMGGVIGVAILIAIALSGNNFLKGKRIDAMGEQFATAAFGEDTTAAVGALAAMDPIEAESVRAKYSQPIQDYFFKVANQKWDLEAKPPKYQFAQAAGVLDAVKSLFPDSARVATEYAKLSKQKDDKLGTLRDEYEARLAAGQIYEDKPGNVVETLSVIGQIDPNYDLFKSKTLPLTYAKDIQRSLDARDYERAAVQVATATKAFPNNVDLTNLAGEVKNVAADAVAKAKERELQARMTAAQAKEELTKLASNPQFSADWAMNVNVAMSKLAGDTSPETAAAKSTLADAYALQIAKMTSDKQLGSAQILADSAARMFPGVPALTQEIGKLATARKAYEAEQAKAASLARVDDLKSGLVQLAKGTDTQKVLKAFNELKTLAPNDPFLIKDAPKAIADVYMRSAERQASQNRFVEARRFTAEGLKYAPNSEELKSADRKYYVEAGVATLQAGAQSPGSVRGDDMKAALEGLRSADPARAEKILGGVQSDVLSRLQALTRTDPASAGKGKAEWLKVFPQNTQLASLVIPEGSTQVASASPSTPTPSLPAEAKRDPATSAPRVRGQESCFSNMSTFGRNGKAQCQDDVAGAAGPKLVVIPNPGGGYLAVTKFEITNGQFDAYCRATGRCKASGGSEALPRTNISLAQAKGYAQWLSDTTGFTYRVPSDAEWNHLANAGGSGAGEDFNCVLMQGGNQIKGGLPVPANSGRPNPWGLVNVVGNAAELTDGGSARGGNFNVPMSQCAVDWRQGGSESDSIGVRLVREMAG